MGDFVSKISFSGLLHLAQDHCRNFSGVCREISAFSNEGQYKTYSFLILTLLIFRLCPSLSANPVGHHHAPSSRLDHLPFCFVAGVGVLCCKCPANAIQRAGGVELRVPFGGETAAIDSVSRGLGSGCKICMPPCRHWTVYGHLPSVSQR